LGAVTNSSVYFVRAKIGFTTNMRRRLKSFRGASAEEITPLLTIPGDRGRRAPERRTWWDGRLETYKSIRDV
jgi:hypothetical protein